MDAKQFVKKLVEDNQALFKASQHNVKEYFDSKPAQEELVEHFVGRMVNERMNMVEISQAIAQMPADTPTEELELLTRQAQDEAKHFRMVKEVIEHMTGQPLDVAAAIAAEAAKPTAKGAGLLAKYGAENDAVALAAYQLVAEGRAEAVWNQMADCIEDEFISTWKLEKLAQDEATQQRVEALVVKMRRDLYDISCRNTVAAAAGRQLVADAYGW
jgi:rubrerythrin